MKDLTRELVLILASAVCLLSCPASAADLPSYRALYQKNTEDVLSSYQEEFARLQPFYLKTLEEQRLAAVRTGDLLKVKALLAEIERFSSAKTLPSLSDTETIQEIKACQAEYVKQYAKVESDMISAMKTLARQYEQALLRMQRELVQA